MKRCDKFQTTFLQWLQRAPQQSLEAFHKCATGSRTTVGKRITISFLNYATDYKINNHTCTYKVDIAILQFTRNEIEDIEVFEKNIVPDLINASFNTI